MSWVETQVPCMLYCGPDLCTCSARLFYEDEDEDYTVEDRIQRYYDRVGVLCPQQIGGHTSQMMS